MFFWFLLVLKNPPFFLQGECDFQKQKTQQSWTNFNLEKGKTWTNFNSIAYIYTYIYICAGLLLICPYFGLLRVISLATSKVISLSTSFGGHFSTTSIGFWGFVCRFWSQLVFCVLCFFLSSSPVPSLSFSNFPKPLFLRSPFLRKL